MDWGLGALGWLLGAVDSGLGVGAGVEVGGLPIDQAPPFNL